MVDAAQTMFAPQRNAPFYTLSPSKHTVLKQTKKFLKYIIFFFTFRHKIEQKLI